MKADAIRAKHEELLKAICDLPTAPFQEQFVNEWILAWAGLQGKALKVRRDRAGNIYLGYRRGRASRRPLVIEAHTDHPGFVALKQRRDGRVEAEFLGGVRPSYFEGARMRWWVPESTEGDRAGATAMRASMRHGSGVGVVASEPLKSRVRRGQGRSTMDARPVAPSGPRGRWVGAEVVEVTPAKGWKPMKVVLSAVKEKIAAGTVGMWDLPDSRIVKGYFSTRVCDDLAALSAMLCMLETLVREKVQTHVIAVCSRAEEVGFAGVLAICENGWLPRGSPIIGLETSKAFAQSLQGNGPVIRVGDRTGVFSAGLTYFMSQTAGHIADEDATFKYQRKLMDGGMCNSGAFFAWGYDAGAMCLALGNYHNMHNKEDIGYKLPGVGTAGPKIASEVVRIEDFHGMVRLLVACARRIHGYVPGMGAIKQRLEKMHREEQVGRLYGK